MKKNRSYGVLNNYALFKMLKIMRFTIIILLVTLTQTFAVNSYSQQTKLTLSLQGVTVEKVLDEVENSTEFYFLYNKKMVDVNRTVDINVEAKTVNKVLEQLFRDSDVSYTIIDRQILLTNKLLTESENNIGYGEQKSITGKVTNDRNEPIPGATVIVKGTTQGTVTDVNGNYTLANAPAAGFLQISFVGMITAEFDISGKTVIDAKLQEDFIGIEEVVAIGYGTMKKADLTGAVSQIKTETLEQVPVYNMEQALKANASGVRVSQNSGQPGARIEVRIRGGNSMIGDNGPLYVVDGFPVTGGINFMNPSDIESIDILKDASATAIYGARGANGVVLITSKRGKKGQNSKIEINTYLGFQQETKRYDLLNAQEYAIIANEWLKNGGLDPFFSQDEINNLGEGTDWQDAIFQTAPIQNHTITFSGSSEKTRYSLSGNYYDQDGIIINSGVKRGSVRLNLDHELNSWLSMAVNLNLSRRSNTRIPVDNGYRGTSTLSAAASAPPTLPVYDEDGLPTQIEQFYNFGSADMRNPLIYASRQTTTMANTVIGNGSFDVKITKDLTFKTLLGIEYEYAWTDYYSPIIYENDRGSASQSTSYNNSFLNENVLTYKKEIDDKHELTLTGGYTYQTRMGRSLNASVSGFANNTTENYSLQAAEISNPPSSYISEWVLASWLARVNYSFNNKYLVTASIRADGSSRFGANNKWATFPSGAFAWRVSEEPFMSDVTFLSDLKFRASYGVTGNTALSPYQSLDRLGTVKTIFANQADEVGFVPTGISNADLKWETTAQTDIGFDVSFFKNKLRVTADYYKKNTTDLLASVPLPPSVGFGSILQNIGEIQNQGFEFTASADIIRTNDLAWNISANFSSNKNKVIEIAGGSDIFASGQGAAWSSTNIAREGEPIGSFYGLVEDHIGDDGLIVYKDLSGPDGTPDGVVNALDRVILGSPHPDFFYGVNSNLSYKNFDLNIILDGVYGNEIFNATLGTHLNSFQRGNNQFTDIMGNYWTAENPDPNAKYPKISSATQIDVSDRFIEDGSYLRVKSIRLGYTIPTKRLGLKWFDYAQVYLSGTNLFTFTKYSGLDPEVNTKGGDSQDIASRLNMGHDQSGYPNAKTYAIGLKLNF
ncbi:TonB-dependent receptor [uncultured Draconibacterium sp.]|uniref:TonB-dependent receptor n=1 Tax=uncultured Draconibacterium sp. TaxID=1573823 RepID=UPI0032176B45